MPRVILEFTSTDGSVTKLPLELDEDCYTVNKLVESFPDQAVASQARWSGTGFCIDLPTGSFLSASPDQTVLDIGEVAVHPFPPVELVIAYGHAEYKVPGGDPRCEIIGEVDAPPQTIEELGKRIWQKGFHQVRLIQQTDS